MKISFIRLEDTAFGGAEIYLQRVCKLMAEQNIEYEVIHGKIPKFLASWIKALLFSWQVKRNKGKKFYFSLARITHPDIYRAGDGVHRAYMKAMGLHFWQNPIHLVYCYLEKRCFTNAKKIIVNSNLVKQEIIDYYQIPVEKIVLIHNGALIPKLVDPNLAKQRLCKELNLPSDKKIILFVGSGFRRKGVDAFLRIIAQLQQDYISIVVGKDKKLSRYQALAKQLGIADKVHFVGQRQDIGDFFASTDIFLFPARYEPFGGVVLEAMSYRCAAITTLQCGSSEFLMAEDIMANPEDSNIVSRIDSLLTDAALLERVKNRNFEYAKTMPMNNNVDKILAVIAECVNAQTQK